VSSDLDGLLVVAVEQAVAAPYASMRLADAGARVIKVERPEGDFARAYDTLAKGESAYFVWLNRGKESICLDLKEAEDRALLMQMASRADVFIQNLKPGTLAKLGLPIEELRHANPRLIACSISGFGEKGPYANLKAYDLIVQAESGLCSITGTPDSPARVGVSVCDIAAGMTAHAAILQALYTREKNGEGRHVQVSLFDSLAEWMNVPYLQSRYGDFETKRTGVNHPSIAPYGAYATSEGKQIIFSVQNQREWQSFCASFMQDPALASEACFATSMDRLANRAALDERIVARFAKMTAIEAIAELESTGIAYGRLNAIPDLQGHPHLRTMAVETEAGELHIICPGAQVVGDHEVGKTVPTLGAHSQKIREEFEN
jgi:crotonobetainyl-CoA:carnitine CoA-transferase CaiB-like acyl-CoA transferase